MIHFCYLVLLYWLSNVAYGVHHWLYLVASREVVVARVRAFRYQSLEHTKETVWLVQNHIYDCAGFDSQCGVLLKEERLELWRLEEKLQLAKNEQGAA